RRHTRWPRDWSSDVCSSDLQPRIIAARKAIGRMNRLRRWGFGLLVMGWFGLMTTAFGAAVMRPRGLPVAMNSLFIQMTFDLLWIVVMLTTLAFGLATAVGLFVGVVYVDTNRAAKEMLRHDICPGCAELLSELE